MRVLFTNFEGGTTMNIGWKSTCAAIALALPFIFWTADPTNGTLAKGGSPNGAAGEMPAFYDGDLFTINISQLSKSLAGKNPSINMIFASNDLDQPQEFIPVINAIQGDGFNPLWEQIFIVFNEGFTPHQFFSDVEIEEAASGPDPEITLIDPGETYRCAVF